jgi:hypothetical protein
MLSPDNAKVNQAPGNRLCFRLEPAMIKAYNML